MSTTPSRILVLCLAICAVAGVGLAIADNSSTDDQLQPVSFGSIASADVQPAKTAEEAVDLGLQGLSPGQFSGVYVAGPPAGEARKGNWLYGDAKIALGQSASEPTWEFDLLQGAVAEALASTADLSSGIAGYTLRVEWPDGKSQLVVGGAGNVAVNQQFSAGSVADKEIQTRVYDILDRYGVDATVAVLRPLGNAVLIVGSVSSQRVLAGKLESMRNEIAGINPMIYDGVYIELADGDGPFVILSTAYRSGAGRVWLRPGVDGGELGLAHG